jgi:hypoxanthine phosphoribosyltransferase
MSEVATVLFTEAQIRRRVRELGAEITRDYRGRVPVLISVLKGAFVFLADLLREIDLPVKVDFMSVSSYGRESEATGGVVRILKDLDHDIGGEHVIVVEDIIDTGLTLSYLLSVLEARNPASVEVCTLLDKRARRIPPLRVRYVGFECPDRFVVGYGLDHGERYRNLRMIVAVDDPARLAADPEALAGLFGEGLPAGAPGPGHPGRAGAPSTGYLGPPGGRPAGPALGG